MKRLVLITAIVLTVALGAVHGEAKGSNSYTGYKLWWDLNSKNLADNLYAFGFIYGVVLGLEMGVFICDQNWSSLPSKIIVGQMEAIVKRYLERHPEKWHMNASVLVALAIFEAFPLGPKEKK